MTRKPWRRAAHSRSGASSAISASADCMNRTTVPPAMPRISSAPSVMPMGERRSAASRSPLTANSGANSITPRKWAPKVVMAASAPASGITPAATSAADGRAARRRKVR